MGMAFGNAEVEPHMCHCNGSKGKINGSAYVQS